MCGIIGYFSKKPGVSTEQVWGALKLLNYRGPDNQQVKEFEVGFLGHARLAIIDLDACSNQPFSLGQYHIVFNGEIYNYQEVRATLINDYNATFTTQSDTEVLLQAYIHLGDKCLTLLNGMFAFAIYDLKNKVLFAARDRVGKKPFFYTCSPNLFCFASEIKSILPLLNSKPDISLPAVSEYLSIGYISAPRTIYEQIHKLEPAHCMYVNLETFDVNKHKYWDVSKEAKQLDEKQISDIVADAVNIRYNSDVPVGVMLSGGLDSNIVLALSKDKKPKTFTIRTEQSEYDESTIARMSSEFFGCENISKTVEPNPEVLDELVYHFDEPMGDSSAIPTFLLSRLIKDHHYRCVLNGDGADEVFAGYDRYKFLLIYEKHRWLRWFIPSITHNRFKYKGFFYNLHKLKRLLAEKDIDHAYAEQNIINKDFEGPLLKGLNYKPEILKRLQQLRHHGMNRFILYDYLYYLPDDLLVKMDRATMANSLESRSPFLDYRLAEILLTTPFEEKISIKANKRHLRKLFGLLLPEKILNRKKTGFQVPIDHWFLHELVTQVQELKNGLIVKNGFVDAAYVNYIVDSHLQKKENFKFQIYLLLIFEKWYKRWATA
jgi:asparagine synthase (glutamine-hydrolysing)